MGRLIEIQDIDEFSEFKTIPDAAISEKIISNIKNLYEKSEMERFLREILYDPNVTPHGPTEIADILTNHVHVRGAKRLTAFVLKGKSFQRVSSAKVTHQFAKLRQIPKLDLMIFGAVGDIQDDAQRDFIQTAKDARCDYLIIDAQDWARLLITYKKICPKDGTSFDETGTCKQGHSKDKDLVLEFNVGEKVRYSIVKQMDLSHNGAKRYSAVILIDRHYLKETIRTVILDVTRELKDSKYYSNERVKLRWSNTPAHVVWLSIAHDLEDIRNNNWVCKSSWIDPSLPENMRPSSLNGNEKHEDIEILWNDAYKLNKTFFESHSGRKEEVLEAINPILKEMIELADQAIDNFKEYESGKIFEEEFIIKMQHLEPRVIELYFESGNIPLPPEDCKDYRQACQNVLSTIHDMFLFYSEKGLKTWPRSNNRFRLMQRSIKGYKDDLKRIEFEKRKIH